MQDNIGNLSYECIRNIANIFKETEKKVLEIEKDSSMTNPIKSDLVISVRNMGYEEIREESQKFIKRIKEIKSEINK